MKFVLYTNSISPHQVPFFREALAIVGEGNALYAYTDKESPGRRQLGWTQTSEQWCRDARQCGFELENCDCLMIDGLRPIDLMKTRVAAGKKVLYMSERWFKPPWGMLRLLHPHYFIMARKFVKMMSMCDAFSYLPVGIHAARDMARLCGLLHGDLSCLFRSPCLAFEHFPGGRIWLSREPNDHKKSQVYCLDKMRMWGYFVAPSQFYGPRVGDREELKILWVGRLLRLKRVDTIVRAVGKIYKTRRDNDALPIITVDIYGAGPEESKLKILAAKLDVPIKFHPPVPMDEVRNLMHEHDMYILSSNAYEGWGAVVSEALEEGMHVIGACEAGSCSTMLHEQCLFHTGDVKRLTSLILSASEGNLVKSGIGNWNAKAAAKVLLDEERNWRSSVE